MPEEFQISCNRPDIDNNATMDEPAKEENYEKKEEKNSMLKVGKAAPDFTAPAYHQGKFVNVKLSEFKGKWTLLCFYPGDFTFV